MGQTARQTQTDSQPASQTDRQPARQTDRQTDNQTASQTDSQPDRQTDKGWAIVQYIIIIASHDVTSLTGLYVYNTMPHKHYI